MKEQTKADEYTRIQHTIFSERERRLINNCHEYAFNDPAGLPGHNLMLIIYKLDMALGHFCDEFGKKNREQFESVVQLSKISAEHVEK